MFIHIKETYIHTKETYMRTICKHTEFAKVNL